MSGRRHPKPFPQNRGVPVQVPDIAANLAQREAIQAIQEAIDERTHVFETTTGGPVAACEIGVTSPKAPGIRVGLQWLGEQLADRIAAAFIQGAANGVGGTDDDLRVLAEDAAKVGRYYVEARERIAKADQKPAEPESAASAIEVVGS